MQWLAPWMLLGLVTLTLPWWLHRLRQLTPERTIFSSLWLMDATEERSLEHKTLRFRLLLALRALLLTLLVLAFAGPTWPWQRDVRGAQLPVQVIALDLSLSMQMADRWPKAVATARSLLDEREAGQWVLLYGVDRQLSLLAPPAQDNGELLNLLNALQPGAARAELRGIAARLGTSARAALQSAGVGPQLPLQLHLISDFQDSALTGAPLAQAEDGLNLHAVGSGTVSNQMVERVTVDAARSRVMVSVRNFDDAAVTRNVLVSEHDQPVVSAAVNVGPRSVRMVTVQVDDVPVNERTFTVRLSGSDALAADDVGSAAWSNAPPLAVPVFGKTDAGELRYLRAAVGAAPALQMRLTGPPTDGAPTDGAPTDGAPTDGGVPPLAIVVEAGAPLADLRIDPATAVLLIAGNARDRLSVGGDAQVTGFDITKAPSQQARAPRIAWIDQAHPALSDLQGWQQVRVARYVQVPPLASDRVLMRLSDGAPLLIERTNGAARMLIFTSALDGRATDLVVEPVFVQWLGTLLRYLGGMRGERTLVVGESAALPPGPAQVISPAGERLLSLEESSGGGAFTPALPGVYSVRSAGETQFWIARLDARESDPAVVSADALARWQQQPSAVTAATDTVPNNMATQLPLGPWLLLVALLVLLAETMLANRTQPIAAGSLAVVIAASPQP